VSSGARGEQEVHVFRRLDGALIHVDPVHEADAAAVMTATDLGKQGGARRQRDPQELTWGVAIEYDLKRAAGGDFRARTRRLPGEPQELRDRVAKWSDRRHPVSESCGSDLEGLVEPVTVIRQIELARAARDGAPVLDGVQELRVTQALHE